MSNRKQRKHARKARRSRAPARRFGRTVEKPTDPLGYDTRNLGAAIDQMIADVKSERTKAAVDAELARIRARYGNSTMRKEN